MTRGLAASKPGCKGAGNSRIDEQLWFWQLRHLVNALAELEASGLSFISLRDNLDLGTPSGRLMFQIIGAMAEFERALIQERVKAGLRKCPRQGKEAGPPAHTGR
jgi:DNA invertase Pin-like site-specific DNA recombinase